MSNYESLIIDDFYKMSFQNIFHYRNINLKKLYAFLDKNKYDDTKKE